MNLPSASYADNVFVTGFGMWMIQKQADNGEWVAANNLPYGSGNTFYTNRDSAEWWLKVGAGIDKDAKYRLVFCELLGKIVNLE